MPIYCDEAGNTGYNLLEENQPFFVYSGLNIAEEEANTFVQEIRDKYRLQSELKGINLIKTSNGRKAIRDIFEAYAKDVKIVFHHKKYALACKFFEYIYEPALAKHSQLFYRKNFNRFVASLFYISFLDKTEKPEDIFLSFQNLLRGEDQDGLFRLFQDKNIDNQLVSFIAEFAVQQKETIIDEITIEGKTAYWVLDLARSALYNILLLWGEDLGSGLEVICDESKPLKEAVESMAIFQDLHEKIRYWNPLGTGDIPINFTLNKPIEFGLSKNVPGLQLADVFASSVYSALKSPEEEISKFISSYVDDFTSKSGTYCIVPQPEMYLTPGSSDFDFGIVTLKKLTELSTVSPKNIAERYVKYLDDGVRAYIAASKTKKKVGKHGRK